MTTLISFLCFSIFVFFYKDFASFFLFVFMFISQTIYAFGTTASAFGTLT